MVFETHFYLSNTSYLDKIEFNIFGNKMVKLYSVINEPLGITLPETYDGGDPKQGGLIDRRLGICDYASLCDTCGLNTNDCPGHFGHAELSDYVYNYGFIDIVKNILNCVCLNCSKLLINKNRTELLDILENSYGKNRFSKIKKMTSLVKICNSSFGGCGKITGKINKETSKTGIIKLIVSYNVDEKDDENKIFKKKLVETLTPNKVYNILRNIDDIDCELMGFDSKKNRPENLVIKILPIPPLTIRPSIKLDILSSGISEDQLTSKLVDIVKDNARLNKQKEKGAINETKYNEDYLTLLQYDVSSYMGNDTILPKSEFKGSKQFQSICYRLKGKGGRIRGNLMGKRVDYSARSVITTDPNLGLDEVGVPLKIAMNLTFPEIVNSYNIDKLTKLVRNGRNKYPGANFVIPSYNLEQGKKIKIDLRYRKKTLKLQYGDIVERHLINGDPILFNRQPTLHKMSMMCHKVKIIKNPNYNTFRINASVTTPYNADFDGDEMNLFVPQTVQTQIEIANIADVKKQIISPADSNTIIKFVQDTIIGAYLLSIDDKPLPFDIAMNNIMYCNNVNFNDIKKKNYTGKDLFSLILPHRLNLSHNDLKITNGKIDFGFVNTKFLKNIINNVYDIYGGNETKNLFDNLQRLVIYWFYYNGFSFGIGDCIIPQQVENDVSIAIELKIMEIYKLITEMENYPDLNDSDIFEMKLLNSLRASDSAVTKKVTEYLKKEKNSLFVMIESGSKGSELDGAHICGAIGQITVNIKRIAKKVNNRTLPYFYQNDDSPEARGFIKKSFLEGISPIDTVMYSFSGREGLIDTAIKTSESGYISRKLMKGMEDVYCAYDKTLRTSNNVVIQLFYCDNNVNQICYKTIPIKLILMSDDEIKNNFIFDKNQINVLTKEFNLNNNKFNEWNKNLFSYAIMLRNQLRNIQSKVLHNNNITIQDKYQSPINISRIINECRKIKFKEDNSLNPLYILNSLNLILSPKFSKISNNINDTQKFKISDEKRAKFLFHIILFDYLHPKKCIYEYKLNKQQFDKIIVDIIFNFNKSLIEPGDMVGTITATTMGEKNTQMSLVGDSKILIKKVLNGEEFSIIRTTIGEFIESHYKQYPENINNIPEFKDSTEFSLANFEEEFYIYGVDRYSEKINWNKISHLSRHPANGTLCKIRTATGRTITATKSHNFLKRTAFDGITAITLEDLKIKDRIPIAKFLRLDCFNEKLYINDEKYILNEYNGWLFGFTLIEYEQNSYLKDERHHSTFIDNYYRMNDYRVPSFIYDSNLSFIKGFLNGIFSVNSSIEFDRTINSLVINLLNDEIVKEVSLLLSYLKIYGIVDGKNIIISSKYIKEFRKLIYSYIKFDVIINDINEIDDNELIPNLGLILKRICSSLNLSNLFGEQTIISYNLLDFYISIIISKANELNMMDKIKDDLEYLQLISSNDIIWDEVESIEILEETNEYVYDFTVPNNETFMVNEGVFVHNTLNTFHSVGIGVFGMQGIPRFREILSYTKKISTPVMIIKFIPEVRTNPVIVDKIESYLSYTLLINIISSMNIIYDPNPNKNDKEINLESIYYLNSNDELDNFPWLYKFKIKKDSLLDKHLSLIDIKLKIIKFWDDYVNDATLVKKKMVISKINNGAIISNFDNNDELYIHIRLDINNANNNLLIDIGNYLLNNILIKGLTNIDKVSKKEKQKVVAYNDDNGIDQNAYEYILRVEGIDLEPIKKNKYIDFSNIYINNIHSAYINFGIEAAKSLIINEINMVFSSGGNDINIAHCSLLADVMTNTGTITSIDRHGINRLDTDPLSRASFEKTIEQLIMASVFSEVDHIKSVSSRVMTGKCIKGGTGLCDIIIDNELIEQSEINSIDNNYVKNPKINLSINNILIDHIINKNTPNLDSIFIPKNKEI